MRSGSGGGTEPLHLSDERLLLGVGQIREANPVILASAKGFLAIMVFSESAGWTCFDDSKPRGLLKQPLTLLWAMVRSKRASVEF